MVGPQKQKPRNAETQQFTANLSAIYQRQDIALNEVDIALAARRRISVVNFQQKEPQCCTASVLGTKHVIRSDSRSNSLRSLTDRPWKTSLSISWGFSHNPFDDLCLALSSLQTIIKIRYRFFGILSRQTLGFCEGM